MSKTLKEKFTSLLSSSSLFFIFIIFFMKIFMFKSDIPVAVKQKEKIK